MPVALIPEGYPALLPVLILLIKDVRRFIDFMTTVFDAKLGEQMVKPDGTVGHTELRIRHSAIMLSEAMEQHPARHLR